MRCFIQSFLYGFIGRYKFPIPLFAKTIHTHRHIHDTDTSLNRFHNLGGDLQLQILDT